MALLIISLQLLMVLTKLSLSLNADHSCILKMITVVVSNFIPRAVN